MTNSNQMFSNMHQTALRWLEKRDPWQISSLSGVVFDGTAFHLESLGQTVTISHPAYNFPAELDPWQFLCLLH